MIHDSFISCRSKLPMHDHVMRSRDEFKLSPSSQSHSTQDKNKSHPSFLQQMSMIHTFIKDSKKQIGGVLSTWGIPPGVFLNRVMSQCLAMLKAHPPVCNMRALCSDHMGDLSYLGSLDYCALGFSSRLCVSCWGRWWHNTNTHTYTHIHPPRPSGAGCQGGPWLPVWTSWHVHIFQAVRFGALKPPVSHARVESHTHTYTQSIK